MGIPELKAKKVARTAANAKAAEASTKKAAADAAALTKSITARAAAYEAEYAKVRLISPNSSPHCLSRALLSCSATLGALCSKRGVLHSTPR